MEAAPPAEGGVGLDGNPRGGDALKIEHACTQQQSHKPLTRRREASPSPEDEWVAMLFGVTPEE